MTDEQPRNSIQEAREALVRTLAIDIEDRRLLEAYRRVPRELFVPFEARSQAYADRPLPICHGQTISQPRMIAIMLQELKLQGHEKVLDVGTGSGYQAALLAELAREVVGMELIPELCERARRSLSEAGYDNVSVYQAGAELGRREDAPYDGIVVAAAAPRVPQTLVEQLAPGGRLVIPIGERQGQDLMVVEMRPEGPTLTRKGPCSFVPLVGKDAFPETGQNVDPDAGA